ncbi:MAG: DNA internalization-related competence protein ComEC/Rec2 [Roseburia sp.]|nr:DNA internalization-related competence protein ComEC/Rec2 [Roseburia sp.]
MTKRPCCLMACGMILGILLVAFQKWYLLLAAILMICKIAASFGKQKKWNYFVWYLFFFVAGIVAGATRYSNEREFANRYEAVLENEMQIQVQGRISKKENKSNQIVYTLDQCYLNHKTGMIPCHQILVYQNQDGYPIGKTILVTGKAVLGRTAVNEGNFDEKGFYFSRKIACSLQNATITNAYGKENTYKEKLFQLQQKFCTIYQQCMEEDTAGILLTMLLGDKSLLDAKTKELYQKAGISHILAISGLHVSFIGMTCYRFLRKRKMSLAMAAFVSSILLISYGMMTGMGTSTKRAVFMFLLSVAASSIGRSYDSASALSLAAIVLLWENPFLLWYAGFLFSYAAVLGVIGVGKIWEKSKEDGIQMQKKQTLRASLSIQLMTLPLAAFYYYEIPVYCVLINALLLPFLGGVLMFGILGGVVGFVNLSFAKLLLLPCEIILWAYEKVCEGILSVPNAVWISGKPSFPKMIGYYLLLFVVVFLIKTWKKSWFMVFPIVALVFLLAGNGGRGFELSMLDVGQGDGIFLRTKDDVVCFVDGGSTDVSKVGTYRILPFLKAKGVKGVDYWFVSHLDADHISGLTEVLESGYPVKCLVFSKWVIKDEAYQKLTSLAKECDTQLLFLEEGDVLHTKSAEFRCLFPGENQDTQDRNAASLVLWYEENGLSALLTGDISSVEEEVLIEKVKSGASLEIYKAAHHGSNYSNSKELLEELHPRIALISCGEGNRYGHPGKEAVAHIEDVGCDIFDTRKCGQIQITRKKEVLLIQKYLDKLEVTAYPVVQ